LECGYLENQEGNGMIMLGWILSSVRVWY